MVERRRFRMVSLPSYSSFPNIQYSSIFSRNIVIAPHCNPTNSSCLDVLTTAYHTLIYATLVTWSPPQPLSPAGFADFVQSVLINLPSSSNTSAKSPTHATIFGDHLVDMIWSVDTELDELLTEARAASAVSADQSKLSTKDLATIISKAKKAQQNAENDKQRIQAIVKKLLVRPFPPVAFSIMTFK